MAAETFEPIVVDAQHLIGRRVVLHAGSDAEYPKDDLGIDTVAVHVLDPLIRVARTAHASLAVLVEPGLGHLVDAVVLAGDELASDRADAAEQPHIDPGFGGPMRPIRPVLDIGHAVLQLALRLGDKQLRRQPREIEMTIGRDPLVLHRSSSTLLSARRTPPSCRHILSQPRPHC
jgi:hypothetical protein